MDTSMEDDDSLLASPAAIAGPSRRIQRVIRTRFADHQNPSPLPEPYFGQVAHHLRPQQPALPTTSAITTNPNPPSSSPDREFRQHLHGHDDSFDNIPPGSFDLIALDDTDSEVERGFHQDNEGEDEDEEEEEGSLAREGAGDDVGVGGVGGGGDDEDMEEAEPEGGETTFDKSEQAEEDYQESETSSAAFDPELDPEGWARRLDELAGELELGEAEARAVRRGPVLGGRRKDDVPDLSDPEFKTLIDHYITQTEWKYLPQPHHLNSIDPLQSYSPAVHNIHSLKSPLPLEIGVGPSLHPIRVLGRSWVGYQPDILGSTGGGDAQAHDLAVGHFRDGPGLGRGELMGEVILGLRDLEDGVRELGR